MKSSKLKVLGIVSFALFILMAGGFYYASTKLRPEEIKKLTIEQAKKVFPKAEMTLQNVEIHWGLNFNVNLENLKLHTLHENHQVEMMSVDQAVVKIPLWAILTGSGQVEIKLDAPQLNYQEFATGNNWTYSMGDTKTPEETKIDAKKEDDKKSDEKKNENSSGSSVLGLFGRSKINVKFSDVSVKYGLRDNSKGELKVSRFLIKGLNFESSTAFEVASTANFVMKDQSKISFDTLVIGQFNISDFIKNGSVTSLVIVKVNNISKTGLEWKFPEITTNIDLLLKKDGELSGKLETTFEAQNKISAKFKMTKQVDISDITVDISLKDIAAIMGLDKSIDMSKAKLISSNGEVTYGEDKKINANLGFSISPGIGYSKEGVTANTTMSGELKDKIISAKVKTEMLEGSISTIVSGQFDPNEKFDMAKLKPFDIRVVAQGMKVPEKFIRAKLWDKKLEDKIEDKKDSKNESDKNDKKGNEKTSTIENSAPPVAIPPSNVTLDWSNINIGGEDFSGHGKIVTSLNSLAIDNLNFKFSKGTGKLTQTMTLGKNASESKFNFEVGSLNLSSFKAFLPPFVENFTGTFTGKVNGSATMFKNQKMPNYDVTVVADAKKGEIKKLNLAEYINPLIASIPVLKDKAKDKQIKVDGNFETLTMKGRFTNAVYTLSSVNFVGLDKKVEVNGSGELYPTVGTHQSVMEVSFQDNTGKISDLLMKNVGTKILPMRLTGPGFDLKPDYGYTISKLAKGALKTQGQDKLKEVLQKNIDKVVPAAAKEKVQGLLDGFFKKK